MLTGKSFQVGLWFIFLLFISQTLAQQPKIETEIFPQYESLFTRTSGWTGADGDYSVALSDDLTLWLYSDTWIGKIRKNRHIDSTIVNNSAALQYGKDPLKTKIKFFWGEKKNGKPTALIKPDDGQGRFWIYDGVLTKHGLYLFLMQIDDSPNNGFQHIGAWLGHIENPFDKPSKWRITQKKIPFGRFSAQGDTLFGSAIYKDKDFIYIYGTTEDIEDGGFHRKYMIAARVSENDFTNFGKWRFYADGQWQADLTKASRICNDIANEYSVSFQPSLNKYVLVYTENGVSKNIVLRIASTPFGEWSAPQIIYQCPEADWDKRTFCYAAKAHPSLSSKPDELIVTYAANSSDFFQMAADARLYRPHFLRLKFLLTEK